MNVLRAAGDGQWDHHLVVVKVFIKQRSYPPMKEKGMKTVVIFRRLENKSYREEFRKKLRKEWLVGKHLE